MKEKNVSVFIDFTIQISFYCCREKCPAWLLYVSSQIVHRFGSPVNSRSTLIFLCFILEAVVYLFWYLNWDMQTGWICETFDENESIPMSKPCFCE